MNFNTIRSKLTVSGNSIQLIVIYKLMGPVSFFCFLKNEKKTKIGKFKKKNKREVSKSSKNDIFSRNFHTFQ